ncbi:hypothetical protein [Sphingomonas sp. Leaf20]|uniref:hypothetical protein n=1 Tax=Sphingomonas sp. Leaf20 TaxID=1735685 RepID=UPI0006F22934|nr:hypothetical protein [Sphingomonas sp. Leaf20]KQM73438.1 hypothetical protein ASE72_02040 [Sphingomonas sp. Leaf20]
MAIALPTTPNLKSATPRPMDFGTWQTPDGGGPAQRLERGGSRFAMDAVTPGLKPEPDSRIWVSRLLQGISGLVIMPFPQPGIVIGNPGSPVVDGAGQAGQTISVRGFAAGYTIREGQFFSVIIAGRRYLYAVVADRIADASGRALLPLWPALRVSPGNGAICEFAAPMIEGALSGNEKGWTHVIARTQGLNFTITEVE